jgi:hypothetical protein
MAACLSFRSVIVGSFLHGAHIRNSQETVISIDHSLRAGPLLICPMGLIVWSLRPRNPILTPFIQSIILRFFPLCFGARAEARKGRVTTDTTYLHGTEKWRNREMEANDI